MWPFKKQPIIQAATSKPKKTSLFSTEWDLSLDNYKKTEYLQQQAAKSFQRPLAFYPVGANGMAMDGAVGMDSQYNDLTSAKLANMNFGMLPEAQFAYFAGNGFIGWQTAAMLSQHWLINKACTMPAEDAARNGYETTVNTGEDIDPAVLSFIRQKDKEFKILPNCVELVRMGRIFGIRIALPLVDSSDTEYYEKPFNIDSVKPGAYRGISQIDPYWVAPLLDYDASVNPAAINFYEPTWWLINGKRIHRSHLVIFRTCELPDLLKPTYLYGGVPVPQWIVERVYAAERTANEAPLLALTKRLITYKMDLTQAAANKEQFENTLTYFTQTMNNFGVKVIGNGENEEIQQFDTSLSELDAVIMTQFQLVAAASEVPATKLLGTAPKGFNSTGEYDARSYHQKLTSIQQHGLSPLVERHHELVIKSYVVPKFGIQPFATELNWNPVDEPTASELADINLKKAQADSTYAQTGAVDGVDIRDKLIADKDSGFNGIDPISDPFTQEEEVESGEDSIEKEKWITVRGKHILIDQEGGILKGNIGQKDPEKKDPEKKDFHVDKYVENIEPRHEIRDDKKVERLALSMSKEGWKGRPILSWNNGAEALTGAHRIAAAKKAQVDIPIYEIEDLGNFEDSNGKTINDINDDDELFIFLKEYGDKEAIKIMAEEIKENDS